MASPRPWIGITEPDHGARLSWLCIAFAIWLAGGKPVRITPSRPHFDSPICGLVLAGGRDIHPHRYSGIVKPHYIYDMPRDALEFSWLERAQQKQLPVLGICRGAQLMNIERGGDLHIDIRKVYEKAHYPNGTLARIFYRKRIYIHPKTLLFSLIGEQYSRVNSMHTQSINRLGRSLKISAEESNRIVQAIEDSDFPMYLGVQFHPEYLLYARRYRNLFQQIVRKATNLQLLDVP